MDVMAEVECQIRDQETAARMMQEYDFVQLGHATNQVLVHDTGPIGMPVV
jgi:hypothetical protein